VVLVAQSSVLPPCRVRVFSNLLGSVASTPPFPLLCQPGSCMSYVHVTVLPISSGALASIHHTGPVGDGRPTLFCQHEIYVFMLLLVRRCSCVRLHLPHHTQGQWVMGALDVMCAPSGRAAEILQAHGATGATDVTGFGLVGHLVEMTRASGVRSRCSYNRLDPLLLHVPHCLFIPYAASDF
jgi:hypothetical protein